MELLSSLSAAKMFPVTVPTTQKDDLYALAEFNGSRPFVPTYVLARRWRRDGAAAP
jgi:hypothetical protein